MTTILTLARIPMGFVFKIPPLSSHRAPSAAEIKQCPQIWKGVVRVVLVDGKSCEVRFEDLDTGDLFAKALLTDDNAVERTNDSSRYFVVRITNESDSRSMFLGLGFNERTDAFDFHEAVASRGRYSAVELGDDDDDDDGPAVDQKDWTLKKPITIKNLPVSSSTDGGAYTTLKPPPKASRARKFR